MRALAKLVKPLVPDGLWQVARYWDMQRRMRRFEVRDVTRDYGGLVLRVRIADPTAALWYDSDWTDLAELAFLRAHGFPRDGRVFDLGAHQGVVAMMIARGLVPDGEVVAVEGIRHNYEIGRHNTAANAVANVVYEHAMIGEANAVMQMTPELNARAVMPGERVYRAQPVAVVTVDEVMRRHGRPDLVFMDIEGFEIRALAAAGETFAARPWWSVEVHGDDMIGVYGGSNRDVARLFLDRGYTLHVSRDETRFEPLAALESFPVERCHLIAVP